MKSLIPALVLTCAALGCQEPRAIPVAVAVSGTPENTALPVKPIPLAGPFQQAIHLYDNDAPLTDKESKFIQELVAESFPTPDAKQVEIMEKADAVVAFDSWGTMSVTKPPVPGSRNTVTMDKAAVKRILSGFPKKDLAVIRVDTTQVDKITQKELRSYMKEMGYQNVLILPISAGLEQPKYLPN